MRQLILTLSPEFDVNSFVKILNNLKGINNVEFSENNKKDSSEEKTAQFLKNLREIRDSIDTSLIDMEDEKTKYILSK